MNDKIGAGKRLNAFQRIFLAWGLIFEAKADTGYRYYLEGSAGYAIADAYYAIAEIFYALMDDNNG